MVKKEKRLMQTEKERERDGEREGEREKVEEGQGTLGKE